jgi:hypothetical protein
MDERKHRRHQKIDLKGGNGNKGMKMRKGVKRKNAKGNAQ